MNKQLYIKMSNLYTSFVKIYGDKFVKNYHTEPFIKSWIEEWALGLEGTDENSIDKAIGFCRTQKEWPPSIAEFLGICEKLEGLPTWRESLNDAINGNFHHPIIKLTYQKVGSWDMSHDLADVLQEKFKEAYADSLRILRENRIKNIKEIKELKKPKNMIELKETGSR